MVQRMRVISGEDAIAYQEWQAPYVQGPITNQSDSSPKPPTAKEMQSLQREAYDEGFGLGRKEGRSRGYKEGSERAHAALEEKIRLFEHLLDTLSEPLRQLDEQLEQSIVKLATLIAHHLVRRELKTESGEIVAVVREAVTALPISARHPRIYLHPEDIDIVCHALSLGDEEKSWRIEEDLLLTRGDCRVETESSYIDASVEARLSAIAAKMLGGERDSDEFT